MAQRAEQHLEDADLSEADLTDADVAGATEWAGAEEPLTLDDVDGDAPELINEDEDISDFVDDDDDGTGVRPTGASIMDGNEYVRCLGHLENVNYFLSLQSMQMFRFSPSQMRSTNLLHLAPRHWWMELFGYESKGKWHIDWEVAADALVQETYRVGVYDPSKEVGKGARLDQGRVVFNAGNMLYVDGVGRMNPRDFHGDNHYVSSAPFRMPDTETPYRRRKRRGERAAADRVLAGLAP